MAADEPAADLQTRLAAELADEAGRLGKELDEIGLLIGQARNEAARHDARRASAEQRLTELQQARRDVSADEMSQALTALLTATRRAALMEGQIDVLEGKQKTVVRMRDRIADLGQQLGALPPGTLVAGGSAASAAEPGEDTGHGAGGTGSGTGRAAASVLDAQEEMRRGIARAMHDGPAQSLTNIILQAQIVQRLMSTDPSRAAHEVDQLVAMVEQTLEATKSFIFDVRPMVLDDLGLVPTLRRVARDRGRRSQVPIDFDSVGADRRLPDDVESALFRCTDEAITGYLEAASPHLVMRMDWTDHDVTTRITATPPAGSSPGAAEGSAAAHEKAAPELEPPSADLPPALAAMIAERAEATRASAAQAAAAAAARPAPTLLPARTWQAIQVRAAAAGIRVVLTDDGGALTLVARLPA